MKELSIQPRAECATTTRILRSFILPFVVFLTGVSAVSQTSLVPQNAALAMNLFRPDSSYATRSVVSVTGQRFTQSVRVQTLEIAANPYSIQLNVQSSVAVTQGDAILAVFWLRRVAPTNGEAITEFVFEQAGSPYLQSTTRTEVEGDGQWTKFNVAFTAAATYAAGGSQMNIRLGFAPQTLDIGGFTMTNYAKTLALSSLPNDITYSGRETNAPWRLEAAARIEQVRKSNLTVLVRDALGYPVPGAQIHAQMCRHAFGFGSAIAAARRRFSSNPG